MKGIPAGTTRHGGSRNSRTWKMDCGALTRRAECVAIGVVVLVVVLVVVAGGGSQDVLESTAEWDDNTCDRRLAGKYDRELLSIRVICHLAGSENMS